MKSRADWFHDNKPKIVNVIQGALMTTMQKMKGNLKSIEWFSSKAADAIRNIRNAA